MFVLSSRVAGATALAFAVVLVLASASGAGPYITSASTSRAHVGDLVRVRAGAGLRLYEKLPLYLVSAAKAPLAYPCTRHGHAGLCRPVAAHAPHGGIYHQIGVLNVRRRKDIRISFRVPKLAPGRYLYVLYCGWCARGSGGSLIAWTPRPTLTVLR